MRMGFILSILQLTTTIEGKFNKIKNNFNTNINSTENFFLITTFKGSVNNKINNYAEFFFDLEKKLTVTKILS